MSQRDLATASKISPSTIIAMESGRLGHLAVLERIGQALGAGLTLVCKGKAATFFSATATSSAWDCWATPQDLLDRLYSVFGPTFDMDPCSPRESRSRVRARIHLTAEDDGLTHDWNGQVYMNPPYGRVIPRWTAKARQETEIGRASAVVGLVPARTDTRWWHTDIAGIADAWLLRGRLAFGNGLQPAPFPSALILWSGNAAQVASITAAYPTAWHVPRQVSKTIPSAAD